MCNQQMLACSGMILMNKLRTILTDWFDELFFGLIDSDADGLVGRFFFSYDENIRYFHQFCIADFFCKTIIAIVDCHSQSCFIHHRFYILRIRKKCVRDRNNDDLSRCKPERKGSSAMLDHDTHKTFK